MNALRLYGCLVLALFSTLAAHGQLKTIHIEQLDSLMATEEKNTVVFIHTDWCTVCHKMEQTTFQNEAVIQLLNDAFYFISLNAEHKQEINYRGHTFTYQPNGTHTGVHELAKLLATENGKMAYPTVCILNTANDIIFRYAGAINTEEMLAVLKQSVNSP